jgi:hypothetical protein
MRRRPAQRTAILSAVLLTALAVGASRTGAHAGIFDLGGKSHALDQDMTERDVTAALGDDPRTVELRTCAAETPNPFACKVQVYRDRRYHLEVVFARADDGVWHVKEWSFK